jgi:hypothetical protein
MIVYEIRDKKHWELMILCTLTEDRRRMINKFVGGGGTFYSTGGCQDGAKKREDN